jgi:hypothetical protein
VEEKGYKSMINLPDWLNIHNIIIKIRKSFENGRIFLVPAFPFSEASKDKVYAIWSQSQWLVEVRDFKKPKLTPLKNPFYG